MFHAFTTIAASIFLEGIFFLLVGVVISGFISEFVTEQQMKSLIPQNRFAALFAAALLGLIFPVCECGIVPVISRLLKKGMPLHLCITMLFASPIVNIVVMLSTWYAFTDYPYIVLLRVAGGLIISVSAGLVVSVSYDKNEVMRAGTGNASDSSACSGHCCHQEDSGNISRTQHVKRIIVHSIEDFFETSKYFIIGILITALIKTIVPGTFFFSLGHSFPASNLFMLFFPYVLSLCSNTDAFIARSLFTHFNESAIICFLVFGAMFDIKTTIMLKSVFKTGFIVRLLLFIAAAVFLYSGLIEIFQYRVIS